MRKTLHHQRSFCRDCDGSCGDCGCGDGWRSCLRCVSCSRRHSSSRRRYGTCLSALYLSDLSSLSALCLPCPMLPVSAVSLLLCPSVPCLSSVSYVISLCPLADSARSLLG